MKLKKYINNNICHLIELSATIAFTPDGRHFANFVAQAQLNFDAFINFCQLNPYIYLAFNRVIIRFSKFISWLDTQ